MSKLADATPEIPVQQPASPKGEVGATWRQSKWLALGELLLVALIFVADARHHIYFSKTPYLLILGWISLLIRGLGWRGVGLSRYRSWGITVALGVACGLFMEGFELFVSQPLLVKLLGKQPNFENFRPLTGNPKLLLLGLALVWPLAAFGEEAVYRGYLMNRVADLFKRTRAAWIISLLAVSVAFGLAHSGQGITGVLDEGLMGILLGLMYLGTRRNLSVPIIAHGVADTIDIVWIFLGHYPGM
jgi:membrane protease YdiL (CAAX protease family)